MVFLLYVGGPRFSACRVFFRFRPYRPGNCFIIPSHLWDHLIAFAVAYFNRRASDSRVRPLAAQFSQTAWLAYGWSEIDDPQRWLSRRREGENSIRSDCRAG